MFKLNEDNDDYTAKIETNALPETSKFIDVSFVKKTVEVENNEVKNK